jgi:hypothetical protein
MDLYDPSVGAGTADVVRPSSPNPAKFSDVFAAAADTHGN